MRVTLLEFGGVYADRIAMLNDVFATIQTMPQRAASLRRLIERLGDIDYRLIEGSDAEPMQLTYLRCVHVAVESDRPWCLHFEDDAFPAPDFPVRLRRLLDATMAGVLLLFSRRQRYVGKPWPASGLRRIYAAEVCGLVGVAIRRDMLAEFADYLPEWSGRNARLEPAPDYALRDYCKANCVKVDAAIPSIIEHADDGVSLIGNCKGKRRISATFREAFGEPTPC